MGLALDRWLTDANVRLLESAEVVSKVVDRVSHRGARRTASVLMVAASYSDPEDAEVQEVDSVG